MGKKKRRPGEDGEDDEEAGTLTTGASSATPRPRVAGRQMRRGPEQGHGASRDGGARGLVGAR